jgi:ribosomal protein S18 acetylase RimI-like enzyme
MFRLKHNMRMNIRAATLDDSDLDAIVHHRRAMFRDMGYTDKSALDSMSVRCRPWLRRKMEANEYLAWFALAPDSSIVAGAGLWLMDWLPHMVGTGPWRGNIVNVYTEPAHRRQGLARALMNTALEWSAANHLDVVILHSSDEGRTLYESLGFEPTNEMRLIRA